MAIWGGKFGFVSVGTTSPVTYAFGEWTLEIDGDDPDTTNFTSGGCEENVPGIDAATIRLTGPYNQGSMPLVRGNVYTFNLGVGPGIFFPIPARVKTLAPSQKVRGKSELSVTAKSTGVFSALVL